VQLPDEEVQEVLDAVRGVVDSVAELDDPLAKARKAGRLLAEWPEQQARLRAIRQDAVIALRAQQVSYRQIAKALGISLARVQQIEVGERGRGTRGAPGPAPKA
jgi:DNA-directed RNA polymerase specialized sigma24 family protein